MNNNASHASADRRLAVSASIAFAALIATILSLTFSPDPTGHQLQMTVTAFGIAIAVAMAQIVAPGARRG